MTVQGQRTFEHWTFPRPTTWSTLEQSAMPEVGRVFLSKQFRSEAEPFRKLHLFPRAWNPFAETENEWLEDSMRFDVHFQDAFLLVVNKPPGMKVHPNEAHETNTLLQLLQEQYVNETNCFDRLRHIHRLDEATQGLVLFATCAFSQYVLDAMMREKQIRRSYLAWVEGKLPSKQGVINEPIGRDRNHPTRRMVSKNGQDAITHYEVLDQHRNRTLVRLRLETGRTHQIRVHLKHLGVPIVNDPLYGHVARANDLKHGAQTMKLIADQLAFTHPWNGKSMVIEMPVSDEFHA